MKLVSIFSIVIIIHLGIIGILLIQPGCGTQPVGQRQSEEPDPAATEGRSSSGQSSSMGEGEDRIDSSFNSGLGSDRSGGTRGLSEPTRPQRSSRQSETESRDTSESSDINADLLEPVADSETESFNADTAIREYKVQSGDTLSRIARREGVSLSALMSANNLDKGSTIYVGQTLAIPQSGGGEQETSSSGSVTAGETYKVSRGDTLSKIAKKHGVTVSMIKSLNEIKNDTIYVGQELVLPEESDREESSASTSEGTQQSSSSDSGGTSYTVKSGDTPSAIASRFGIDAKRLMEANDISDPRKLYAGKTLTIPGSGDSTEEDQEDTGSSTRESREERSTRVSETEEERTQPEEEETTESESETESSSSNEEEEEEEEDPMEALESLEDDDLPFVEVEEVDNGDNGN